uniref:Uncharacterized protein n=1 Tax=Anopheles arabiensis TaxID=7173 RepID=A0A182IFY9_ANOAR
SLRTRSNAVVSNSVWRCPPRRQCSGRGNQNRPKPRPICRQPTGGSVDAARVEKKSRKIHQSVCAV